MSTAAVPAPSALENPVTEEILAAPEVRAALEALEDPEDGEDLIHHLKIRKR